MSTVATRTRPTAFNFRHQVIRKTKLGLDLDSAIQHWQSPKHIKELFGAGPVEAKAVGSAKYSRMEWAPKR